mmetsp:Transcript_55106/g.125364  ORF Transcript_55106/g.125364 Transcript_55106/m.125364 type:complete len:122 (+) Transcript_55106:105-470(+)
MKIGRFIKFVFFGSIFIFFGIFVIIFGARIIVLSLVVNKTRNQWMYSLSFGRLFFVAGNMTDSTGFFFFILRCYFFVAGIMTDSTLGRLREQDMKNKDAQSWGVRSFKVRSRRPAPASYLK